MKNMIAIALLILAAGCGSSTSSSAPDATTSGGATYTLALQNYLSWCSVIEQGTSEGSTAAPPLLTVPAGTVVNLSATPSDATFVWGYWVGTDGDTSNSHDTNMTTTVTMSKNKTVQVCCPFAVAAGSTPVPCPPPT
jgi:hypothetical protein